MENAKIPIALGLIIDDVGWHNGADERNINLPARSGIPRRHHPDDVLALNEIGKGLNMKIGCSLVLGEWDKSNKLRGVDHITPDPDNWDMASEIDMDFAKDYFKALEDSEYIEYTLHGLYHSYYEGGLINTPRQYYPNVYDKSGKVIDFRWLSEEEFEKMIDLFYDIYDEWGFKKKIEVFVSPCGCHGNTESEGNRIYAKVLKKRGIKYWNNSWHQNENNLGIVDGIAAIKGDTILPWNAYDADPDYLPLCLNCETGEPTAYLCGHLVNFMRYNPEKNFEYVDNWVRYFKRYSEAFGVMLARDTAFSGSQYIYHEKAKLDKCGSEYVIDLSEVDGLGADGVGNEFYISFKKCESPVSCTGGSISLYEEKEDFRTYKITRDGSAVVKVSV